MKKKINPIDAHVGARIRKRRTQKRLSQSALGGELGVTFQQVQKYESGANRVSASKLWTISKSLNRNVGWFFDGLS